jgi:hypothetical protein
MKNVVVFIDIDGPLMPTRQWMSTDNHKLNQAIHAWDTDKNGLWYNDWNMKKQVRFDPVAVTFFNAWIEFADAKIVVSSNWSHHTSKEELQELFELNGLRGEFHEDWTTPSHFRPRGRYSEINEWVGDHPELDNYLIVDDDGTVHGLDDANKAALKHAKSVIRHWQNKAKQGEVPVDMWDKMELERAQNPYIHKLAGHVIEVDTDQGITLKQFGQGCKILNIDMADINERWYGVKKLTPEELQERERQHEEYLRWFI